MQNDFLLILLVFGQLGQKCVNLCAVYNSAFAPNHHHMFYQFAVQS